MCPDKQLLSVYHDGELPSPWKEKMAAHLAVCPACQAVVDSYARLSGVMRTGRDEATNVVTDLAASTAAETVRERVWMRLSDQFPQSDDDGFYNGRRHRASPRVRRAVFRTLSLRIEVPLPIAAAAAVILVLCAAFVLRAGFSGSPVNPAAVAELIDLPPEEIQQITTMGDALRFIEGNELFSGVQGSYVIMRMPENRTFYTFNNPEIRNASGVTGGGIPSR
jgi:hypothetical protein